MTETTTIKLDNAELIRAIGEYCLRKTWFNDATADITLFQTEQGIQAEVKLTKTNDRTRTS